MFLIFLIIFQINELTYDHQKTLNISFDYQFTIGSEDDGFYDNAYIFYSKPFFIVFDKGNSVIRVYDNNGHFTHQFGEAGNGPNHLSDSKIWVIKDKIIASKRSYITLFDINGNVITSLKKDPIRSCFIVESKQGFIVYFKTFKKDQLSFSEYDLEGNLLSENIAKTDNIQLTLDVMSANASIKRAMYNEYHTIHDYIYFNSHFYTFKKGEFKLIELSNLSESESYYTYPFSRISIDDMEIKNQVYTKRKRDLIAEKEMNAYREKLSNGFMPDIINLNGSNSNYLFITLQAHSKKDRKTLVVNKKMKLISEFIFYEKDLKSWTLSSDYLMAYFKDDYNGPYFKIYKVTLN